MTPTDILIAARAKIAQGWTRRAYARNAEGEHVAEHASTACAWCALGALRAAGHETVDVGTAHGYVLITTARRLLEYNVHRDDLIEWNDDYAMNQAEVLAAFDRAIEHSKSLD